MPGPDAPDIGPLLTRARAALKSFFGYEAFRPGQERVIRAALAGRDVLAILPTGAGKSVCFQVPALCLPGYTLVISPLISLMADQARALRQAGIAAACLNSAVAAQERREILARTAAGERKLLYLAPERLQSEEFRRFAAQLPPALVAIDEAHCVSQWGHNFRPDYAEIAAFIESLPKRPPVCAFTATATAEVRDDIANLLGLREPCLVTASFDRPNLSFAVRRPKNRKTELLALCRERAGQSGIVYCQTRKNVEDIHALLAENGIPAARYHAGLSLEERRAGQEDFVHDRRPVMVATNAFGMGIDKSNVSFVIHYNLPLDLEGYYQEAGRAGRDGEPADCILLYAASDLRTAEFLLDAGLDEREDLDPELRERLRLQGRQRLRRMAAYATATTCLRRVILSYFGEEAPTSCGNCGNCRAGYAEEDVTTEAQKILSCVYRLRERGRTLGRGTIVAILRGAKNRRLLADGFDTLSTYGIMAETGERRIHAILDALVEAGLLRVNEDRYPVIAFTERSMAFLRAREPFVMQLPKNIDSEEPGTRRSRRDRVRDDAPPPPPDEALFEKLKALRSRIAAEIAMPAYIVFSNATLRDMCAKRPQTQAELLAVSGVGETKAVRYGERFLEVVREHRGGGMLGPCTESAPGACMW